MPRLSQRGESPLLLFADFWFLDLMLSNIIVSKIVYFLELTKWLMRSTDVYNLLSHLGVSTFMYVI